MNISITLAQLRIEYGNPTANLNQVQNVVNDLPVETKILLLPELWSSSYLLEESARISRENVEILSGVQEIARKNNLIIGGSLLQRKEDGELYNTFNLVNNDGTIAISYDKIHLIRLMDEQKWMQPGSSIKTFDFSWGKIGLAICYDLRFPELFRKYALQGCSFIFLVAEWPIQRIEHWKILLQARAIENQIFIAAVNNVGLSGDAFYGGNSLVIDPWGKILAEGSQDIPELLTATMNTDEIISFRKKIPVYEDRRQDIYG